MKKINICESYDEHNYYIGHLEEKYDSLKVVEVSEKDYQRIIKVFNEYEKIQDELGELIKEREHI